MAPLVWMVVWVDAGGRGLGMCGHRHASLGEATLCPFVPEGLPDACAGLVREVRGPVQAGDLARAQELAARMVDARHDQWLTTRLHALPPDHEGPVKLLTFPTASCSYRGSCCARSISFDWIIDNLIDETLPLICNHRSIGANRIEPEAL
jgi:hypothetical protein